MMSAANPVLHSIKQFSQRVLFPYIHIYSIYRSSIYSILNRDRQDTGRRNAGFNIDATNHGCRFHGLAMIPNTVVYTLEKKKKTITPTKNANHAMQKKDKKTDRMQEEVTGRVTERKTRC